MAHPEIPLLTLVDSLAPYKGTWCLVQHVAEDVCAEGAEMTTGDHARYRFSELKAIHTTYHPDHGVGCEIECLNFAEKDVAQRFVCHLLLHSWRVRNVQRAGESFWIGIPQ